MDEVIFKQAKPKEYFPQLTGIRAFAGFMNYFHHLNPFSIAFLGGLLNRFCNECHIGLTIFFTLSGFIITYRYIDNFELSKAWFKPYLLNRVGKIYPIYILLSTLTFIVWTLRDTYPGGVVVYLANITFLKSFFDDLKFTGIAQGWSLTVEECFYFSLPVILSLYLAYKKLFLQPVVLLLTGFLLVYLLKGLNFYGFFGSYFSCFSLRFLGAAWNFT